MFSAASSGQPAPALDSLGTAGGQRPSPVGDIRLRNVDLVSCPPVVPPQDPYHHWFCQRLHPHPRARETACTKPFLIAFSLTPTINPFSPNAGAPAAPRRQQRSQINLSLSDPADRRCGSWSRPIDTVRVVLYGSISGVVSETENVRSDSIRMASFLRLPRDFSMLMNSLAQVRVLLDLLSRGRFSAQVSSTLFRMALVPRKPPVCWRGSPHCGRGNAEPL